MHQHLVYAFLGLTMTGYSLCLWIGGIVVVSYTLLGGYMAVCWTDFIQGSLMFVAIVLVPTIVVCNAGETLAEKASLPPEEADMLAQKYR